MRFFLLLLLLVSAPALGAEANDYAKPDMVINGSGLSNLLHSDAPLVVLDVRPRAAYDEWHVPSARWIDIRVWKAAFGKPGAYGADAEAWSERIGQLGIDSDTTVVVYDKFTSPTAARAWWLLRYWGVSDVRILNGGDVIYRRIGTGVSEERAKGRPPTEFQAVAHPERLATSLEVLSEVSARSRVVACLIDTRSAKEFEDGAIPSASHSDWAAYVDAKTGRLKPPAELRRLLKLAGMSSPGSDPKQGIITYCRSGGRAALVAFVAELVGGEPAANYWGSWTAWQARESPTR
ncbi:MAG: rhodanese-like domain-containing protein [Planctomycetota bacterium]